MATITTIEGVDPAKATKLRAAGIRTVEALLDTAADKKGRRALAGATGLDEGSILSWVNVADLMRISGVSRQYSELLEAAGVDTVKELRRRNAENLAAAMLAANTHGRNRLVKRPPSARVVAGWIGQAKDLPPVVTH